MLDLIWMWMVIWCFGQGFFGYGEIACEERRGRTGKRRGFSALGISTVNRKERLAACSDTPRYEGGLPLRLPFG